MPDETISKPVWTGPHGPKRSPKEKSAQNPANIRFAIAAHCYHSCHGQDERNSHTTKLAIKQCTETGCHLWPFRGFQDVSGGTVRSQAKKPI